MDMAAPDFLTRRLGREPAGLFNLADQSAYCFCAKHTTCPPGSRTAISLIP